MPCRWASHSATVALAILLWIAPVAGAPVGPASTEWDSLARLLPEGAVPTDAHRVALSGRGTPEAVIVYHLDKEETPDRTRARGYLLFAELSGNGWKRLWRSDPVESLEGPLVLGSAGAVRLSGLKGDAYVVSWRIPSSQGHRTLVAGYGIRRGAPGISELFHVKEYAGRGGAAWKDSRLTLWSPEDPPPVASAGLDPLGGRPLGNGLFTPKRYWIETYTWTAGKKPALTRVSRRLTEKWFLPESVERADLFDEHAGDWLATEPLSRASRDEMRAGEKLLARKQTKNAISHLQEAARREPLWRDAWLALGRAEASVPDDEAAAAAWREVLKLDDRNEEAALGLGIALTHAGDLFAAESALHLAVVLRPDDPVAWQKLAGVFERNGETVWASQFYRRSAEAAAARGNDPAATQAVREARRQSAEAAVAGLRRLDQKIRQQRLARGAGEEPDVIVQEIPTAPTGGGTPAAPLVVPPAGIPTGTVPLAVATTEIPPLSLATSYTPVAASSSAASPVAAEAAPSIPPAPPVDPRAGPTPAPVSVSLYLPAPWEKGDKGAKTRENSNPPAATDSPVWKSVLSGGAEPTPLVPEPEFRIPKVPPAPAISDTPGPK